MTKKLFVLLLLTVYTPVQPIIGEILLGAAGAAAFRVTTSSRVRWAAAGYFLKTPTGQQFAARGFDKMRQIVSNRFFSAQMGTGTSTALSANIAQASRNALQNGSQRTIQAFRAMPKNMAEFRAAFLAMSFRNPFSKVTEFHAQTKTTAFASEASTAQASANNTTHRFAQAFTYRKPQTGPSTPHTTTSNYSAHQAQGLFPRINNYYTDQGSANFWKGFAAGSFTSWTTAWYLNKPSSSQKEKEEVVTNL